MDDLDYRAISPVIMKEMSSRQRFVRFEERLDTSDMSSDMMLKIAHGKYLNAWKGVPFLKDCLSLAIVQKLFWEEKPQTVIELGAWKGGSALWSADMLKILGVKSHVFSMDIDLSLLDPVAKECPDVTFIEGNSNEIEKCFPPELLQTLPHPWFITEDVHINIVEVLKYFDKFTEPGDYICVEDTNPLAPNQPGQGLIKELGYTPFGHSKLDKLKEFMKTHSERYLVDQLYTDLFGAIHTFTKALDRLPDHRAVEKMEAAEYHPIQSAIDKEVSQKQRYARFQDRQDKSDMPTNMMLKIAHGKYWTSWRGIPVLKDCLDLIAVQELFWELKPRTVIELGAYKGGSALWAADMLKMIGVTSRVLSVDIDLSLLDPVAKAYPDVTFIQGDSLEIDKCFPPELLQELPHPWFITEDAHVNVTGVLEYFDKFTEPDDYICVEDTNPIVPNSPGQGLAKELGYTPLGSVKLDAVKLFMKDKGERYLVDQRYADFFGYNVTWNMNSYLKRV